MLTSPSTINVLVISDVSSAWDTVSQYDSNFCHTTQCKKSAASTEGSHQPIKKWAVSCGLNIRVEQRKEGQVDEEISHELRLDQAKKKPFNKMSPYVSFQLHGKKYFWVDTHFVPGEGVVKDECVEARVPCFHLSLNCLFMGIAASQRNQNLRAEQKHRPITNLSCGQILSPNMFLQNMIIITKS